MTIKKESNTKFGQWFGERENFTDSWWVFKPAQQFAKNKNKNTAGVSDMKYVYVLYDPGIATLLKDTFLEILRQHCSIGT